MTEQSEDLGIPAEQEAALDPNVREALKRSAATRHERDEAITRAAAAERKLAFLEAGIPPNKLGELFMKGYDGEVTPDAIRTSAAEYGIMGGQQTGQGGQSGPSADDMERMRQIAAAGGAPPPAPNAQRDFMAALGQVPTGTPKKVMAVIDQFGGAVGVRRAGID